MTQASGRNSEAGFYCPAYIGLRGVLLLAVLQGHYWYESRPDLPLGILTFAVPCFFALSGFLISHTLFHYEGYPRGLAIRTFYVRRALRILPPFFLVLGVAHWLRGVPYLAWQATYLINFKIYWLSAGPLSEFSNYLRIRDFNAMHFWSVCVEEQFYLLYPVFVYFFPRNWRTLGLCGLIALTILSRLYFLHYQPETFYGGLPMVAGEYILWGCLLAWWDHRSQGRWLRTSATLYLSLGLFLCIAVGDRSFDRFAQWRPPAHQTVYCLLLACFILALRYNVASRLGRFLSWRPLQFIGTSSYGAYLVHSFLNPYLDLALERFPPLVVFPQCPRAVLGTLATITVARLLWVGFERPIHNWRGQWRLTSE